MIDLSRRLFAEWFGTMMLVATVVGSGIMAERLAGGNVALALLGNTHRNRRYFGGADFHFRPIIGGAFQPRCFFCLCITPVPCPAYCPFIYGLANRWRAVWHHFGASDV